MLSSVTKAKSAVIEGRVIRLQVSDAYYYLYIFLGKNRDYILNERMCSCKDFLYNVMFRGKKNKCYHQLALEYALEKDMLITIEINKETLIDIIMEIYTMDKSFILRKILFSRGQKR
ncbi:SWIM zinc finger family protein [Sulfurisphaera javensis]|uniref:SWIM zinc finger family protein n=1 Tax=Sulfurisphaera javensis TaxID=2049879 RepID=UPI0034E8483F